MPGVGSSEEEYRRRLERMEQMSIPRGYMGYGAGHGARLRGERRAHEIAKAGALAKASMAERERAETGLTRRKGMKIAGTEREKELEWIRGTGESAKAQTGLRGAGMKPRDTFADRTAAYKQAGKQMESLFPADREGLRINPATGKPFTEKEWGGYRQTFANKALEYAGGGLPREEIDPMAGKGFISTDSDVWSVDEDLPYEQQIMRRPQISRRGAMMRAGLGGKTSFRGAGATGGWPSSRLEQALADPGTYYGTSSRRNRYLPYE